MFISKEDGDKN